MSRLYLTLIRHAKSDWQTGVDDFERPLNDRGARDAPAMAAHLAENQWQPDSILASPARRAAQTAQIIAEHTHYAAENIIWDDELYLAVPRQMLRVITRYGQGCTHIAVVSHNPGTTDLAEQITGERLDNVPTCGVVQIALFVDDWAAVSIATGELVAFDYPKKLR